LLSPREKIVPVQAISPLIALSFERDWNRREMFPFVEFEGAAAAAGQYVSYSEAREAFARARRRLGEGFAIDYARRKSLAFLGIVGLGMMVQPTVGAALRFALQFHALAGSVLALEWEAAGEEVSIAAADLIGDRDLLSFWHVDHLVTIASVLMQLPGDRVRPLRLEFEQELPADMRRALAFAVERPVVSPAERTRLVYSAGALATPLRFPDLAAGAQWRLTAEREQAALVRAGVESPISRMVSADGKLVGRRDVARRLGVSERSLDRLLAREGVRFSELAEARRLELAKSLLGAGRTVDETAERVGYSDARAFRRAFKRLAGVSPIDFKTSA
jgi:AraC-like DNA-binding protein